MNHRSAALLLSLALPFAALAADPPKQAPAPPPPGMDEPGVKAAVDNAAAAANGKDANGQPAPTVTVRHQGDDTVEEYRQDGQITMIKITPKNGMAQTFISSPDGKLVRDTKQGPVDPVYFTVYQWK